MKLLPDWLRRPGKQVATRSLPYFPDMTAWQDIYLPGPNPFQPQYTYGVEKAEQIGDTFCDYVIGGLQGNGVVWSIERVRVAVFSEVRFQFQKFVKGRPGNLFSNPDLGLLERPWTGGTTGDLAARMIIDADMAGNFFGVVIDDDLVRLRPDWVEIVFTERYDDRGMQVGWKKLGYLYYEGGKGGGREPAVFLPEDVVHFAPMPDPLATWRGMSWLTPVVREIMSDTQATKHKLKFFENAATPNLAVQLPKEIGIDAFGAFVDLMDAKHKGANNAYKTLYTGGGADVTVVGADMKQLDFKVTQGAGESRLAAAGGVHPAIVGLSEGLQGSSLNAGNFGAARRLVADGTMRPLWRNAAGSLEVVVPPPPGSRLWYDARDVAFLREDAKDEADIAQVDAQTVVALVNGGFTPESAKAAVLARNMDLLVHSGLISVQLQPPPDPNAPPAVLATALALPSGADPATAAADAEGLPG